MCPYATRPFQETILRGVKVVATPMEQDLKVFFLWNEELEVFQDNTRYRYIVKKLIYLTITHAYIGFDVGVIRQFKENPKNPNYEVPLES